jgi:hypothetical protein
VSGGGEQITSLSEEEVSMANREQRGNREKRKPKAAKSPPQAKSRLSLKRLASPGRKNRAARRAATSPDRLTTGHRLQAGPSSSGWAIMPRRWGFGDAHVRREQDHRLSSG